MGLLGRVVRGTCALLVASCAVDQHGNVRDDNRATELKERLHEKAVENARNQAEAARQAERGRAEFYERLSECNPDALASVRKIVDGMREQQGTCYPIGQSALEALGKNDCQSFVNGLEILGAGAAGFAGKGDAYVARSDLRHTRAEMNCAASRQHNLELVRTRVDLCERRYEQMIKRMLDQVQLCQLAR